MKVSLYTITLNGGYYDGPHVPLLEIFPKAKKWGYQGIEIEGKRPHGNPMDLDAAARDAIKKAAADNGLEISAISAYNDFSSPVDEQRECELLMAREQIRLARGVGAPVVRVFPFWSGVSRGNGRITYDIARYNQMHRFPGTTALEHWCYARDCLAEISRMAEGEGVTLALQNHKEIIYTYKDMLAFIHEIDSPALKACLDVPLMVEHTEEYYREALTAVGDLQVHTHFGGRFVRDEDGKVIRAPGHEGRSDDMTFYRLQKEICNFQGHNGYELCSPVLTAHRYEGLDYALLQAELAAGYMRQIIEAI